MNSSRELLRSNLGEEWRVSYPNGTQKGERLGEEK
jgi:hypothetical protein